MLLDGKVLDGWHRYQACLRAAAAALHPGYDLD
jgi:hypothetical protein